MTAHDCPASGCARSVPAHMLMCKTHWHMVPAPIRSRVWNAWDDGLGAGTPEHTAAIVDAVVAVNEKLKGER